MRSWDKQFELPVKYSKLSTASRRLVRNQYVREQQGLCYWCNHSLECDPPSYITSRHINWSLFPPHFLRHPIHLQHCHATDLTEGAVHAYCNAVMWQYHGR